LGRTDFARLAASTARAANSGGALGNYGCEVHSGAYWRELIGEQPFSDKTDISCLLHAPFLVIFQAMDVVNVLVEKCPFLEKPPFPPKCIAPQIMLGSILP
jgi:hypothetical protein